MQNIAAVLVNKSGDAGDHTFAVGATEQKNSRFLDGTSHVKFGSWNAVPNSLSPCLQIFQNLSGRICARSPCQACARMRSGATQIQVLNRSAIARPIQHRAHGEELVERQFAMKNVASG